MHLGLGAAARKGLTGTVVMLSLLPGLLALLQSPGPSPGRFIKRRNPGPLARHLCNKYRGWIWKSRCHFMRSVGSRSLAGIRLQSQARGLAESNRNGLGCLGTRSTWVVTDAVWAPLVCCSSKLCASLLRTLFLSIFFCPQTSQTTNEVSWEKT